MNKLKNIFSFIVITYFFISVLQMTPYNFVALTFSDKQENQRLTEFNKWRKLPQNKEEYQKLLDLKIEKKELSFKKVKEQTTEDGKFTITEVKEYASKIDFFEWISNFRNQLLEFNFLAIFIFILFLLWKRWSGKA